MHTGSLLTRLQRLRECDESFEASDLCETDLAEIDLSTQILFKDSDDWQRAYDDLKSVLHTREHVPRRAEPRGPRSGIRGQWSGGQ